MKTSAFNRICTVILAGSISIVSIVNAQTTTTTRTTATTTHGSFTEFVPASKTIVIRTEANPAPIRYAVTQTTTVVDETGTPITFERIPAGAPLSVEYTTVGDQIVASKVIVRRVAAPAAPVVTERITTVAPVAPIIEKRTTTTTTTRPMTKDERKAAKEAREKEKEKLEDSIDKQKEELEKLKDKVKD